MHKPLEKEWPRAVLLDFYGTVVEEIRTPVHEIFRRISSVHPQDINEAEILGHWARAFLDLCARSYGSAFQLQKILEQRSLQDTLDYYGINLDSLQLSSLLSDYRSRPSLFPESREVLSRCSLPVCLLTNIDNREIVRAVEFTGLHFDFIVTSEDCQAYKPRPENFRKALSCLGLPGQAVLHVGDSLQSDIKGARETGIRSLWINRRKRLIAPGDIQPDYSAADLTGLLELVR